MMKEQSLTQHPIEQHLRPNQIILNKVTDLEYNVVCSKKLIGKIYYMSTPINGLYFFYEFLPNNHFDASATLEEAVGIIVQTNYLYRLSASNEPE